MIWIAMVLLVLQCNLGPDDVAGNMTEVAVGEADHVLPFPVGSSYKVSQGNFSGGGHSSNSFDGVFKYAFDFRMPVGSVVTATREGEVVFVQESYSDDDHVFGHENVVAVRHRDGSYSRYVHLTKDGATVHVGLQVFKGDTIGYSGNSGYSFEPHLHFDVVRVPSGSIPGITSQSIFVNFANSAAYPNALKQGHVYVAGPYRSELPGSELEE